MTVSGAVNVLKPPGMTSHDVVGTLRRIYGMKRVGHAGTLDPAAAGVLPIFLGQSTRLIEYLADADKSYRAEITFGYSTDSGDDTGQIIEQTSCVPPSEADMQDALASFVGSIEQVPPMHSAIKIGGQKLYELARKGMEVERSARKIHIYQIKLIDYQYPMALFDVTCSKGTYIRTLCADIGRKLKCPAVMSFLVRTRVGGFHLSTAASLEEIAASPEAFLIPAEEALPSMPRMTVSAAETLALRQGKSIAGQAPAEVFLVFETGGGFVGVCRCGARSGELRPLKILVRD